MARHILKVSYYIIGLPCGGVSKPCVAVQETLLKYHKQTTLLSGTYIPIHKETFFFSVYIYMSLLWYPNFRSCTPNQNATASSRRLFYDVAEAYGRYPEGCLQAFTTGPAKDGVLWLYPITWRSWWSRLFKPKCLHMIYGGIYVYIYMHIYHTGFWWFSRLTGSVIM